MSTLQQRIDEYLGEKASVEDSEDSKADVYVPESEGVEMPAIQVSLDEGNLLVDT